MGGEESKEGEEAAEAVVEEEKLPATYHALDPVFVVNLPPGGKAKMLQVSIQAMAREPDLIEFLKLNDPMVRHTLLALFGAQEGDKLRDRKGKEALQKAALDAINKIVKEQGGPGEVEAIFFTSFVMQ
jgi:flagellar FliL protein